MKVIKNYIYNSSYQLLAIIIPLITAPYISRTLKPKGVGIYSYTNSLIQWFVILAILGIDLYGQKQIASVRENKKKLTKNFWEIQILKTILTCFSFIMLALFLNFYNNFSNYMWLQSLNIVAAWLDISWLYMGLEDFKITVIRNTIVKIVSLILIFLFIKSEQDTQLYIFITGFAIVLGNLTLWPYIHQILCKIDLKELHPFNHIKATLAYFVPQNAAQIYLIVNKNMLGLMDNTTSAGFYNNADNLVRVVLVFVTSVSTVMMPHIANEYSKGNIGNIKKYTYTSLKFVSAMSFAMSFGLASIAVKGAVFFYGSGFKEVGLALLIEPIIIIFLGYSNTLGAQYLVPTNRVNKYTESVVIGTVCNIVLNLFFIKFVGLYGAMISTVISEFIVVIYQIILLKNELSLRKMFKDNLKYLIAGIIMFIIVFSMNICMKGNAINLVIQIIVGAFAYLFLICVLQTDLFKLIKLKIWK